MVWNPSPPSPVSPPTAQLFFCIVHTLYGICITHLNEHFFLIIRLFYPLKNRNDFEKLKLWRDNLLTCLFRLHRLHHLSSEGLYCTVYSEMSYDFLPHIGTYLESLVFTLINWEKILRDSLKEHIMNSI